jgi:hypothetical protein
VPSVSALGPNQHHALPTQIASSDEADLAVVIAVVGRGECQSREHFARIGKIEAPLLQGLRSLRRIEGDLHSINVATKILGSIL